VGEAARTRFRIARAHVLAACLHVEDGCATNRLLRVPTDELKALAIREVIGKPVDGVFGNSIHDHAMLEIAKHPFCINPTADLEQAAQAKHWPIYWPTGAR
jgi:phosphoserine phosphatase